ncbi:unnamed protein product [Phytophthora fragariaefolia]|uniref:Unnamed protein product n=1 Tax=Phytophthora fragariaefolia TaxID=1490495 RepID=A0A9W6XLA1_9STRA|nr:unnamed protein product [Phytophthora fragariaefolia]
MFAVKRGSAQIENAMPPVVKGLGKWKSTGIKHDKNLYKAQLLELVRTHKPAPFYMAVAIATMYGHHVSYTPPYHPELQPIELIWGNMKGWIGRNPAKTIGDLEEMVATSQERIMSKEWKDAYKEVQKEEDKYLCVLEEENIECADASDGEVESNDSDSQAESF